MGEKLLGQDVPVKTLVIVGDVPHGVFMSEYAAMAENVIQAADKHPGLYEHELADAIYRDLIGGILEDYECGNKQREDDWERLLWQYAKYVADRCI